MFKEFARNAYKYLHHVEITSKNAKKIAEILFYLASELEENIENITVVDDLRVKRKSVFESKNFKSFFIENVTKEIEKSQYEEESVKIRKIINRAYFSKNDVISQKKAMLQNKSKYSDLDLILAAIDISSDEEISKMYVTVRALKDKLDEETYSQLRKFARKKYKSCRIDARYFLYILQKIEEFECEDRDTLENKEKRQELENVKTYKKEHSKTKSERNVKNIDVQTSEYDYIKRKKGEKLDAQTKYKLYLYRQKYAEGLRNTKLSRMTKDDLLFFLVNTEPLVENESPTPQQVLKIIRYADSNQRVRNPVG